VNKKIIVFLLIIISISSSIVFADYVETINSSNDIGENNFENNTLIDNNNNNNNLIEEYDEDEYFGDYGNRIDPSLYDEKEIRIKGNKYNIILIDDSDLLDKEFMPDILEMMLELSNYLNVMLITTEDVPKNAYESYAKSTFDKEFGSKGVVFLIDMNNRALSMYSDVLTSANSLIITDNVYKYAEKGDFNKTSIEAFKLVYSYLTGEKVFSPMQIITNILLSISISFLIVYYYIYSVSKIKKSTGKKYSEKLATKIDIKDITGRHIGTKRVYSPRSESSGGGRSHGGGGGGHSSGGGGSHRF